MPIFRSIDSTGFPAGTAEKYYTPMNANAFSTNAIPTTNVICFLAYYIKKNIQNPTLCIEKVSDASGVSADTIKVGIYDGSSGLYGANLLSSGQITPTVGGSGAALGIFTTQLTINLKRGFYIIAGVKTAGASSSFKIANTLGQARESFGIDTTITSFNNNNFYTQTGQSSLPQTIGTITASSTAGEGVSVFLKY
jgi:hypothetical protein